MEGIILSLYSDKEMESVNARQDFKFLSWSPYDRIRVKKVNNFSEFFQSQFQTKWVGVAQQMHLISEYPEEFHWQFDEESARGRILIQTGDVKKTYGLCAVVMARLAKSNSNQRAYREEIYHQLEMKGDAIGGVEWNAFYSLGAEDIVFIVLANSVRKIRTFIEELDMLGENKLFSKISSFVNMNKENWNRRMDASLLVRLNLKSGKKEIIQSAMKELCNHAILKKNIKHLLLGKCVLDVRIPAKHVDLRWFSATANGIFNGESTFYKQYIASSRSYWFFESENDLDLSDQIAEMGVDSEEGKEKFSLEEDRELMESCCDIPIAQFVIKEYHRLIHSTQSGWWSKVLEKQFHSVKIFLREYAENGNKELLNALLRQIQNILLHIRQSTISTTEVPYLNYIYAGSYNDIMKMYYGIISELFDIGFQMEHDEEECQYEISFCVDFESTAYVHSDMYKLPQSNKRKRFVVFHLPFDAFTDIEGTVKFLCHEVFHYIAPYSRKKRNRILLNIWSRKQIQRMLGRMIDAYRFSDELKYLLGRKYIVGEDDRMTERLDRIYDRTRERYKGYDRWIINKFWGENRNEFRRIYKYILDDTLDDLFDRKSGLSDLIFAEIAEGETNAEGEKEIRGLVRRMLDSDSQFFYSADEVKHIAHAYREAFSDLNTVHLFGLDVAEYLQMFYQLEVERNITPKTEKMFREAVDETFVLRSYERRLGMTLYDMIGSSDRREAKRCFVKLKESGEKTYIAFLDYVEKVYLKFLHEEKLFLKYYQMMFEEVKAFWGDAMTDQVIGKKLEFEKIKGCGDDLEKNILVMDIFSQKEIAFDWTSKCVLGKNTSYYPITEENDISYGEIQVENLGQFFQNAYCASRELIRHSREESQPCWYRGVCNEDFSLLPSLYRLYHGMEKEQIKYSIYAYQTKVLQDAYYLTMKMSDLWTEQLHGIAEHTSCLQHYGMPTTLLDFSLDMLVALYFALNPDREEDRESIDIGKYTPKVVLFNPVLYNKALWSLRAGKVIEDEPYIRCSPVMFDSGDQEMRDYFVSDMSVEKSAELTKKFLENAYVPDPRIDLYPKPIIIQQTNSRVLSQNGIFMAYHLNALPDQWEKPFEYLDLKEIQEAYLKLFDNEKKKEEAYFLREIIIDPLAVHTIRRQLNMLGMNKAKMYPELSEIFRAYSN